MVKFVGDAKMPVVVARGVETRLQLKIGMQSLTSLKTKKGIFAHIE